MLHSVVLLGWSRVHQAIGSPVAAVAEDSVASTHKDAVRVNDTLNLASFHLLDEKPIGAILNASNGVTVLPIPVADPAGDPEATMAGPGRQQRERERDKLSSSYDLSSSFLLGRITSKRLATCWILEVSGWTGEEPI